MMMGGMVWTQVYLERSMVMRMRVQELALLGLVGWTAIGIVGVLISVAREERAMVRTGLAWLAGVWVVYMGVLVAVSLTERQRVVAIEGIRRQIRAG
jgi:hypothetical protein